MPENIKAEEIEELTLDELCSICHVPADFVVELIQYGTIEPKGELREVWRFSTHQIHVIQTAVRLHHDLEVNHAGIALAVELLQEIEDLREQLQSMEKYFSAGNK